jgi:hypothetical protein
MFFFVVIYKILVFLQRTNIFRSYATEGLVQQALQRIWAIGLMESWFCIWDDLANPKNGLNLVPNPL